MVIFFVFNFVFLFAVSYLIRYNSGVQLHLRSLCSCAVSVIGLLGVASER